MPGKRRCKHHGGASPGAPKGNKNAFRHGLYSDALLPDEQELWGELDKYLDSLDEEIKYAKIRLRRLSLLQKEADEATLGGTNEVKALQLEELSTSDTDSHGPDGPSSSRTRTVVKKRRDYHAEIRHQLRIIGELTEKRAKLLAGGDAGNEAVEKFRSALQAIESAELGELDPDPTEQLIGDQEGTDEG